MSLFIKNANLPESGSVLLVYADGSMSKAKTTRFGISALEEIKAKAEPVPEKHGRLIDADELFRKLFIKDGRIVNDRDVDGWEHIYGFKFLKETIIDAKTVVEREGGE